MEATAEVGFLGCKQAAQEMSNSDKQSVLYIEESGQDEAGCLNKLGFESISIENKTFSNGVKIKEIR